MSKKNKVKIMGEKKVLKETETQVFFNIDFLNLGNNFTYSHMIKAIKENETAIEYINTLMFVDLSKDLVLTTGLKFGDTIKYVLDLSEFLNEDFEKLPKVDEQEPI